MDPISILIGIVAVIALFSAIQVGIEVKSPEPGNPKLPTVSQSRKIPLAVGRTLVSGPNVLDAAKHSVYHNSQQEDNYGQNIEMAIAYGPGILYSLWSADKKVWEDSVTPLSNNGDSIYIDDVNFYGGATVPGKGGLRGHMDYCRGDSSGYIFPNWEAITGRLQPGYPTLARVLFYGGTSNPIHRFYWGNAESYRPVEFEYGFFPNPLSHPSNHIIGNGNSAAANPAYVLYEILKSNKFGTSSPASVDTNAIAAMAATLSAEALGIRRTWYTESALEIEKEILDLIDGVRYRDPATGHVVYKLLRDDYTGIPIVTDAEILNLSIAANSMSGVPNKLSVTYLDGGTHYKEKKLTETNIASRTSTGFDIQKDLSFMGAGDSATAAKILTREVRKASKPRRSGRVTLNRIAWDWARGDTFIINSELEGIVSLPVRVNEHKRNDLTNRQITIDFIEEVFVSGGAIFDIPVAEIDDQAVNSAVITDFAAIQIPRHLYRSGIDGYDKVKFGVLAADPVISSDGYFIEVSDGGVWVRSSEKSFVAPMTPTGSFAYSATTIVVQGSVLSSVAAGVGVIDDFVNILMIVRSSTEYEFLCYRTATLDPGTGITTFANCTRGLYGPQPLEITPTDKVYPLEALNLVDKTFNEGYTNQLYRLVDVTAIDETTTTDQTISSKDIYNAPQAPGRFGFSGDPYPPAKSGWFDISFYSRNYDYAVTNGMASWASTTKEALGANETMSLEVWDKTNNTLLLAYVDRYTSESSQRFMLVGTTTEIEVLGYTSDSVTGLTSPNVSTCTFDYTAPPSSAWWAKDGGSEISYDFSALVVTGLDGAGSSGIKAAVNSYSLVSGKYYFEIVVDTIPTSGYPFIGIIDDTMRASNDWYGSLMAVQFGSSGDFGGSGTIGGFVRYDTICVAVDTTTREVWIRKNTDAWAGGGDPTLGTTPYKTLTGTGAIVPYVDLAFGQKVTARFGSGHNKGIPAGYAVWE